jgi:hypothetical protein
VGGCVLVANRLQLCRPIAQRVEELVVNQVCHVDGANREMIFDVVLSYRKLRPRHPANFKLSWQSFYTGVVLTTTLELRELEFLIRRIDEYIQVMEFMIRKTPALDQGELALARKLRTKLSPGKPTDHRRKNIANKPG